LSTGPSRRRRNICACFSADSERRWTARLAASPADPAQAALIVLGFHPDGVAEPIADGIERHTLTWSISNDEAVLEALEHEDLWESLGEAIPCGWALVWPEDATAGGRDLGGWQEHAGEIEIARLIMRERDLALVSADRETLLEIAAHLEASLRGLIAPRLTRSPREQSRSQQSSRTARAPRIEPRWSRSLGCPARCRTRRLGCARHRSASG
jgi:hypothetical protein